MPKISLLDIEIECKKIVKHRERDLSILMLKKNRNFNNLIIAL